MKATDEPLPGENYPLDWRCILAPTDFSKPSEHAVKTAAGLAAQCDAKIVLLHIVQLPASVLMETTLDADAIMAESRASLDEMAREIPAALIQEKLVRLGAQGTVSEIIVAARETAADLIVIGTHGQGRLEKVLLGSTAEKVVRHAPCPVLVARRKEDFSKTNPKGDK